MNGLFPLLFQLLLLIGAVQGVVLAILLLRGSTAITQRSANRVLACLLFFAAYRLLVVFLREQGLSGVHHWSYYILLESNWVLGPLVYGYARAFRQPNWHFLREGWPHLLPVAIELAFSLFIKSQNLYWDGTRESLSPAGYYGYQLWMHTPFQYLVAMGLVLVYAGISLRALKGSMDQDAQPLTAPAQKRLGLILMAFVLFATLFLLLAGIDYLFFNYAFDPFYLYPGFSAMALLTYWLGMQAVLHRQEIQFRKQTFRPSALPEQMELAHRIQALLEREALYLNPKLKVADLGKALHEPPFRISQAINTALEVSFPDLINEYRVREVQKRLSDPAYAHYSLLAIGLDSGFNSKASFNRAVKKFTGQPPGALPRNKEPD